jgi:hypothetical protein
MRQLCEFYIKREEVEQSMNPNISQGGVSNSRNNNISGAGNDSDNTYNSYRS